MRRTLCTALSVTPEITLYHTGPALDHGPLPTLFYFALSGPDSLSLDPYNQIVQLLSDRWIRIFSLTLPAHEAGLPPSEALATWAEDIARGIDPITPFLEQVLIAIDYVQREQLSLPNKIAVAGLSRGGFIASHVARLAPQVRFLLTFAPLTRLELAKEFQTLQDHPLLRSLDLFSQVPLFFDRKIRFYIGNHDTRVSTRSCVELALLIAESAHIQGIRSPQIELILSPSIGHMGHGTSPEIFQDGAHWIGENLCMTSSS